MKLNQLARKLNYWATPIYDTLPSWCFPESHPKFKAYCVGMAKTGTVSIHIMFSRNYQSAHEPESRFLIHKIVAFMEGRIDKAELTKYVKHRSLRLRLEMDSSHLNYFLLDILVNEFKEARFILTIRDCYSWLDSLINHQLFRTRAPYWHKLDQYRFKTDQFRHSQPEKVLADNNLYPLDSYFSSWKEHNTKVLTTVPKDRLLVVKTHEISHSIDKIQSFIGIDTPLSSHIRKNTVKKKFNILSQINKNFIEEKANTHCKELMNKYFPEVTDFNLTNQ